MSRLIPFLLLFVLALPTYANAQNEYEPQMRKAFDADIKPWLSDPAVIEAVKAQNAKRAALTAAEIDALDKDWRAQVKSGGPMIQAVLGNALSEFLKGKKAAGGAKFSEIFVMDNKGLNVGQSDPTSDYMQGDEAKWQKTFQVGPDAIFIDDVDFDDSSGVFQSQLSASIVDPADGSVIGAITIGMAVEELPQ